jgi:hypothetical protein
MARSMAARQGRALGDCLRRRRRVERGVKKSPFALEARRAEDNDAQGGARGRPRRSSGRQRVVE